NGSTADSGSVCHGSNPCRAATFHLRFWIFILSLWLVRPVGLSLSHALFQNTTARALPAERSNGNHLSSMQGVGFFSIQGSSFISSRAKASKLKLWRLA